MLPINFTKEVTSKLKDQEQLLKIKNMKKSAPKSNNIFDIMERIRQDVEKNLGQFKDEYQCITDIKILHNYIDKANEKGYLAIDTETTGLNPLTDQLVGLCLFFPGEKPTYVPVNHYDYFTNTRLPNQLTEEEIGQELARLTTRNIFHNAPFDIRVLKNTCKVRLSVFWDTLVGGQILDENEAHGLKYLHGKYISQSDEKSFSDLFGKVSFKFVPIKYAYLYAAHDAIDTYELAQYQIKIIRPDQELTFVAQHIEIPMIDVIVDLEENGVAVDKEYLEHLKEEYHKKLQESLDKCTEEIETKYMDAIQAYNAEHISKPFELPPNISSSQQLQILFYQILHEKPVPDKKPTSTDEDVMKVWSAKYDLAKYILEYRGNLKLVSTYIDNMDAIIHTDGRVHTHFNSCGARTGRLSSSQPINLQNIPSKAKAIRKMFVGQETTRDVEKRSDNAYILDRCEEVQVQDGTWKFVEEIKVGDTLMSGEVVKAVKVKDLKVLIGV